MRNVKNIAEMVRHVMDAHTAPLPAILEIPSKVGTGTRTKELNFSYLYGTNTGIYGNVLRIWAQLIL